MIEGDAGRTRPRSWAVGGGGCKGVANVDLRPWWVRFLVRKRATRAQMLIQCWIVIVASLLCLVPLALLGSSRLAVALAAVFAVEAVWQWLTLRWIDRYGAWRSIFD